MKLFGRRKAKALAAGTVPASAVFTDAPGGTAEPGSDAGGSSPDPITAPVPVITASVPVIGGGAPAPGIAAATDPGTTSPNTTGPNTTSPNTTSPNTTSPVTTAGGEDASSNGDGDDGGDGGGARLRFGFGDDPDAAVVLKGAPERTWSAPTLASGEGAVALAPPKVVSIGFGTDLDELETELPAGAGALEGAATAPGVDPRLRARRIQVRRDESRKRLKWVVLGAVVVAVLAGVGLVLGSPLFAIDDVEVTGAAYIDPARLQEVVADLEGSSLLAADLGKARAELAEDPWVKRVRVERRPLRGIRIEIVERTPVATFVGTDQRWRVIDSTGKVMAVLDPPGSKPVDPLELALAAPGPDLEPGATVPPGLAAAASLVPRLPPELRTQTCSLAVGEQGDLRLTLCDGFPIELGPPERLRDKLVSVIYVLTNMGDQVVASSSLDVTDPGKPALLPK